MQSIALNKSPPPKKSLASLVLNKHELQNKKSYTKQRQMYTDAIEKKEKEG